MFDQSLYQAYLDILKEELVEAIGCTEPIAVSYAAATARHYLDAPVERVRVLASANIIKNVKSVVVPNTGGLRGIAASAAAGIAAGRESEELQVLSQVTEEEKQEIRRVLEQVPCEVAGSEKPYIFHIEVTVYGGGHSAVCEIAGFHTNIIRIMRDQQIVFIKDYQEDQENHETDRSLLNIEKIVEFAECVALSDVRALLQNQIDCNMKIAEEGLRNDWGARIGKILLNAYGSSVNNRAKAWAAAGSDARMGGCELPVVINSGSGNQGMTASVPVIVYARDIQASEEELFRALVISNLVTIHLKTGIGRLSAYCGATSAGCGAGAGITWLYGGRFHEISHTIVNAVAINSGMICDGAKASCAAKIASAVEAGLLGMQMQMRGSEFVGGDGIVVKGVENTIRNIGRLAHDGMAETDREIIHMMTEN